VRSLNLLVLNFLAVLFLSEGCSVRQDKWANRTWHALNTRYNGYFNGNEALKEAEQLVAKSHKDDFYTVVSPFRYGTKETAQGAFSQLDRTIKKGVLMIRKHSMLINGKQKNKWIDDCYFIMGKANFFKREHSQALQQLNYVINTSESERMKNLARLWIIKTYIDMGEFTLAENEFNKIGYPEWDPKLKADYYLTLADFFIKQDDYKPAVIPLQDALGLIRKKKHKGRPHFILGQIYQKAGLCDVAREHYALARKYKPDFELEFQASVNLALCMPLDSDNEALKKTLRKLAKEEKNTDYRDQIFYALAILAQKEGKEDEAVKLYQQSAAASTKNPNQKGLSYLALAEIFMARHDYVKASAYYDSCLANLSKKHPDYERLAALKDNMGEIARLISIVNREDSLQAIAALPEKERLRRTEKFVENLRKADEEKARQQENKAAGLPSGNLADAISAAGKWYFYNSVMVANGMKEFQKIWGNRKNEDNWRRKNKASDPTAILGAEAMTDSLAASQKAMEEARYQTDTYLAMLPLTDSALAASNEKIYDALYDLGLIYKERLKNYPEALKTFENLEKRRPSKHVPVLYYQMYILGRLTGNERLAEKYKNIILENYPESEYARMLTDPDYLKKLALQDKQAEALYEAAWQEFRVYRYEAARILCDQGLNEYGKSSVAHRFALLRAKTLGGTEGKNAYVTALEEVVKSFPGTESAAEAKRILEYLGAAQKETPEKVADKTGAFPVESKDVYKPAPAQPHFVVLTQSEGSKATAGLQKAIANFNTENYGLQTFDITAVVVGTEPAIPCVVIKEFTNRDLALEYMRHLISSPALEELPEAFLDAFVITKENFVKLLQRGNIQEYLRFFYENYKVN
jgi:tetratricopeptide (TPR) repeat protein